MDAVKIFVRVKNNEDLKEINLVPVKWPENNGDLLWESTGDYFIEAFQCQHNLSICSIEKDPRIISTKHEIYLMLMDAISRTIPVG